MGVGSLPMATGQWCPARTQTRDLWITSPMPYQWHQRVWLWDQINL